jgi:hypothetical protein
MRERAADVSARARAGSARLRRGGWSWWFAWCLVLTFGVGQSLGAATAMPFAMPPLTKSRVVIVQNGGATETFTPQLPVIREMVDRGVMHLTGKTTLTEAWRGLVSTQDTVGIKVFSSPGALSGTRPAVVEAVITSLLAAGQPPAQIIVWDKQMTSLKQAGLVEVAERQGVRVAAAADRSYDTNHFYASALLGQLVHGDYEFGREGETMGRNSYVSKLVTQEMTKIISVVPLLNHNLTSVSGHLANVALGSVDNTIRFTGDAGRLAVAVPEIYALPVLGDRVVLNITDALLAQYYGEERTLLHYSAVLNQLRFSKDPVALDVLSVRELELQRERAGMPAVKANLGLYQNASLVQNGVSDINQIQVELVP